MLSEKASNPVDVRITGRLDTIHELLNFTDVLQEVRDSECLVYKALKTSLLEAGFLLCALGRTAFSRYPLPKSLPSGEGLRRRSGGAGLQALSLRSGISPIQSPVHKYHLYGARDIQNRPSVHENRLHGARGLSAYYAKM